jgi:hypothetical protein
MLPQPRRGTVSESRHPRRPDQNADNSGHPNDRDRAHGERLPARHFELGSGRSGRI